MKISNLNRHRSGRRRFLLYLILPTAFVLIQYTIILYYNIIRKYALPDKISTRIKKVLKICEYFVYLLDNGKNISII